MIRLTRLNNQRVVINPDHIAFVDATPDTTLCLIGGDKILVRETIEELVEQVVEFRRRIRTDGPLARMGEPIGDPPRVSKRPEAEERITSIRPPAGSIRGGE
jgi:flagellar protein FlbD